MSENERAWIVIVNHKIMDTIPRDNPFWWELIRQHKDDAIREGLDLVFIAYPDERHADTHTRTVALAELKNII